ncbi:hypothetical protein J4465_02270 [Candidatus Pacearchaeota archaeon]|nr:hypothetical protein [Candidatus Pacearchaeota archaeon]
MTLTGYLATYEISCGVSPGYGIKGPSHETIEEKFSAEGDVDALRIASIKAIKFSRDYLSNPAEDDFTTVTLIKFLGPNGQIDIRDFLKKQNYDGISINGKSYFTWNDKNQLVTKCHMLEHLMLLGVESEIKRKESAQDETTS